jgi:cell division septum initiation protein DivIVA
MKKKRKVQDQGKQLEMLVEENQRLKDEVEMLRNRVAEQRQSKDSMDTDFVIEASEEQKQVVIDQLETLLNTNAGEEAIAAKYREYCQHSRVVVGECALKRCFSQIDSALEASGTSKLIFFTVNEVAEGRGGSQVVLDFIGAQASQVDQIAGQKERIKRIYSSMCDMDRMNAGGWEER